MKKLLMLSIFFLISPFYINTDTKEFFTDVYIQAIGGKWGNVESVSGPGSTLQQTEVVRVSISEIITNFNIKSILDAPCGDFNWMRYVDIGNCAYIGIDVVKPLIEKNISLFESINRKFHCNDLLCDLLPAVDLIICRDFLVHLSNEDTRKVISNFKKSGSRYLLTTTFIGHRTFDIQSGGWRPLNLQDSPFNFPAPLLMIEEKCTEQNNEYADKSLALWKLDDISI